MHTFIIISIMLIYHTAVLIMELILDGNSKIGVHAAQGTIYVFDLFKAFAFIESSHKFDIFFQKMPIFLHACTTCSELPYNKSTMV